MILTRNANQSTGETMRIADRKALRGVVAGSIVASVAAMLMWVQTAEAKPSYQIMRQLTHITTGTIESVKIRSQDGNLIAFVSTGDVMGPGTETAERQIYLWTEQEDGSGVITRITNQPGCESYDIARPTDTVLSSRPGVLPFVSTCDFDLTVGNADGNPEIFFYDVDAQIFEQITDTVAPVVNGEPYASDSGRCLVFRSNGDLNDNTPAHPNYDDTHPGPGFSNPDLSDEIFLYGKLDKNDEFPYGGVFTQVSNGPAGTTSSHPVINGYWFARQCQTTAYQSDHDQIGQGLTGQGIYVYKMPANALEPVVAKEIPYGFPDGIYRNPNISAASPFARGPHIVFEGEPDLWRNESEGTNIYNWRDFHPRMTQYTRLGAGFHALDPEVGDGGGVISFSSNGELLTQKRGVRTGEEPPFNADGNSEIFYIRGRRKAEQITQTTGCENIKSTLDDDGARVGFISTCDLIPGQNPGGVQQIFLRQLERHSYPLVENPGDCLEAEGCCLWHRRQFESGCYHGLEGAKPKIDRPNCIDKSRGCRTYE